MRFTLLFLLAVVFVLFSCSERKVNCIIFTELGDIEVEMYPERAPVATRNFLAYVKKGAYTGSSFFRVCTPENEADRTVKIEVIQGGNVDETDLLPPIRLETTRETGIRHRNGVLSMARTTPNSAQSSFFICIGDQPELDYGGDRNPDGQGFGAFGKVTSGMEVVLEIQQQKEEGQYLLEPVGIKKIEYVSDKR